MKIYRLMLMVTLAWTVLSTGISAQSIKKSKNQTIELKNYTSHQLKIASTPKGIDMLFIKNVGEIETEYWISFAQTSGGHKSFVTLPQDNFSSLKINSGSSAQSFDLSKSKIYRYLGTEIFRSTSYVEHMRIKITQADIEKIANGDFFEYTLTLRSDSPGTIKVDGKNWIKLQASFQKLLNA